MVWHLSWVLTGWIVTFVISTIKIKCNVQYAFFNCLLFCQYQVYKSIYNLYFSGWKWVFCSYINPQNFLEKIKLFLACPRPKSLLWESHKYTYNINPLIVYMLTIWGITALALLSKLILAHIFLILTFFAQFV